MIPLLSVTPLRQVLGDLQHAALDLGLLEGRHTVHRVDGNCQQRKCQGERE